MTAVLDASAVLALIYREPGHEQVAKILTGAVVSTVNWAEVYSQTCPGRSPEPGGRGRGSTSEPKVRLSDINADAFLLVTCPADPPFGC